MRDTYSNIDVETLDLLPYGIIVLDRSGSVLYYNPREEQISGRQRASVLGRNFFTEIAPCTAVREFQGRFLELVERPDATVDFDFTFAFPTGAHEVRISMTAFDDRDERLCIVAVADETERRRLQRQLARQERLRVVGETAAGVAHNFNNLLTSILGNAELALRRVEDPRARASIETILQAANDGANLVRRIRDFTSEAQPGAFAAVDVNPLARDAIALATPYVTGKPGARIETDLADDLPQVFAVDSEMREVLVNLLHNAADALEGPGRVTVSTRREGDRVVIRVRDTGRGLGPEVRERIFVPFFTTKGDEGTGLGLATCAGIVRRHGGDIEVESEVGRGSTFAVSLPAAPPLGR